MGKSFPKSLVDVAANEIRERIMNGELALGQRVTESNLAARFGMSKTPMREALQVLQREGLIVVRPRRGTFVFNFTEELMASLRGVRLLLESYALREAVAKNRGRLLNALGKNVARSRRFFEEEKIPPYLSLDMDYHSQFFRFADNPFLDLAYSAIQPKLMVLWHLSLDDFYDLSQMEVSIDGHENVAELILEGDIDGACAALDRHNSRIIDPPPSASPNGRSMT